MEIKKTGFYEIHKELNAKIVEFAGYFMPVQYKGIIDEHKRVRTTVGLFDVSHMGEFIVRGANAEVFLQNLTINNIIIPKIISCPLLIIFIPRCYIKYTFCW